MRDLLKKNVQPTVVWSLIGAIAVIVLLTIFIQLGQVRLFGKTSQKPAVSSSLTDAMLILDYGNGKVRRFQGPIAENAKVWDMFQQAIAVGGINVEISDHFIPQAIDGLKSGIDGKHWNLYVNGVKQKFTPFEVPVNPGAEVVFKFE